MFSKMQNARKQEQEEIKNKITPEKKSEKETKPEATAKPETERTTITLSLSAEDKMQLKLISIKKGKTMSALIHDFIEENKDK